MTSGVDDRDGRLHWFGGCESCRAHWAGPVGLRVVGQPRDLGESLHAQAHIMRCQMCGMYWLADADHPYTISRDEALRHLPDLVARENRAGF